MTTTFETIYEEAQQIKAMQFLEELPEEINVPLFSEWAEENRYIPPGVSDFYGPFDPMVTPHLIEPLNRLHPDDPCTHVSMMKSVQSANTTTIAENALGAYIRYKLGSILFLTSTKGIGNIRGSANIDTLIDNSNLAEYVKPMSNRTGRKTKDNSMYKEFDGGIKLLISSYKSIGDLKSNTWHLIIRDEWDEAGAELKDQGDIAGIIEGRTKGIRNFKILDISTPSRMETSRIYKSFMEGDQREYFLPCPLCGEKQILILKGKGEDYGLTFTREKDEHGNKILIPETVRYICQFCKKDFYESKKQWMLENGIWIPQAIPTNKKKHSYHSSGLIAPETFLSWERICQDFIDTDFGQDILKMKDFTINDLGNPWAAVKKTSKWQLLKNRAEEYSLGEIPGGKRINISGISLFDGPIIFFSGVDVQGDRLECLTVGFGINGEKWIVDQNIFYGNTAVIDDPCWLALHDYIYHKSYKVLNVEITITLCAIDAGWDPRNPDKRKKDYLGKSNIVYEFVAPRQDKFIAVMGNPSEKVVGILQESRVSDPNSLLKKRYMVSVSILKEMIMSVVENTEGYNCIHIPKWNLIDGEKTQLSDEFYQQFLSERYQEDPKKPGNYKWIKVRNRNEVLDTFIYAIAAANFKNVTNWTYETWSAYYTALLEEE
jgi:phage terminase large subunit GpA-like protein